MNLNFRNNFNNINFQKTLVARANILTNGKPETVNVFHLDSYNDVFDLTKASKTPDWQGNYYIDDIIDDWDDCCNNNETYSIENKDGKVLCYSVLNTKGAKASKVEYIETAPKTSCYNQANRKSKYIGETMLTFFASKLGKKDLVISKIAQRPQTIKFYNNCGFEQYKTQGGIIKNKDIKKLIKKNFKHTGKKIELIV